MTVEYKNKIWDFWTNIEDYNKHEQIAREYSIPEFSRFVDSFFEDGSCPYFFKMQRSSVSLEDYENFIKSYRLFENYYNIIRNHFYDAFRIGHISKKSDAEKYKLLMMPYFIEKHGGSIKDFSNIFDLFPEGMELRDWQELLYRRNSEDASKVVINISRNKEKIIDLLKQFRTFGLDIKPPPFVLNYFNGELDSFNGNIKEGVELIEEKYGEFVMKQLKRHSPQDIIALINFVRNSNIDLSDQYRSFLLTINDNVRPPMEFLSFAGRSRITPYETLEDSLSRFGHSYPKRNENSIRVLEELEKKGWCIQEQINEPKVAGFMMTRSILLMKEEINRLLYCRRIHFNKNIHQEAIKLFNSLYAQNKTISYRVKEYLDIGNAHPPINGVCLPLHEDNRFGDFYYVDDLYSTIEVSGKKFPITITEFYADICKNITSDSVCSRTFNINSNTIARRSSNLESIGESYRFYRLTNLHESHIVQVDYISWKNGTIQEKRVLDEFDLKILNEKIKNGLIASIAEKII